MFLSTVTEDDIVFQASVPWRHVLTNPPYLCALVAMAFHSLGYFLFLTEMPTYLGMVLKFSIENVRSSNCNGN